MLNFRLNFRKSDYRDYLMRGCIGWYLKFYLWTGRVKCNIPTLTRIGGVRGWPKGLPFPLKQKMEGGVVIVGILLKAVLMTLIPPLKQTEGGKHNLSIQNSVASGGH